MGSDFLEILLLNNQILIMRLKTKSTSNEELGNSIIYLNIDHLQRGQYELQVLNNNKVIKRVSLKK